jgi:hypothetical protein
LIFTARSASSTAVGDRLHLPRVLPGAEQEEIGERVGVPEVEHHDVERLLVELPRAPLSRCRRSVSWSP